VVSKTNNMKTTEHIHIISLDKLNPKKHDAVAECGNCKEQFSYSSKKDINWECPYCYTSAKIINPMKKGGTTNDESSVREYQNRIDHEEIRIIDTEHLGKFCGIIYNEGIVPFLKEKDFAKTWKNGKMFKASKDNVMIFCTAYNQGQMSFLITKDEKRIGEGRIHVLEFKAPVNNEKGKDVGHYFKLISKFIFESLSKDERGYIRFKEIDNSYVNTLLTRGEALEGEIFGVDSVSLTQISAFVRAMNDISYIRGYWNEED
jgi:hypothetical protein